MNQIRRGRTPPVARGWRQRWIMSGNRPVALVVGIATKAFGMIARSGVIGDEDTAADGSPSRPVEGLSATAVRQGSP